MDDAPGQVLIARGESGWSWCIPLRKRPRWYRAGQDDAAPSGPRRKRGSGAPSPPTPGSPRSPAAQRRVTDVGHLRNYQQISERSHGRGWVMVGDAFGLLDPMLSPGVFSRCARPSCRGRLEALA